MRFWKGIQRASDVELRYKAVAPASGDVLILAGGESASLAYFIEPYIARRGQSFERIDPFSAAVNKDIYEASTVVIARYLPEPWIKPLRRFREAGGNVIYFMDDDLMDPGALATLPRPYSQKIVKLATRLRKEIESLCNEFWVSTAYLASKYPEWRALVLPPLASTFDLARHSTVTICYHGTASHQDELAWLPGIVSSVQKTCLETRFEVFGDHEVNRKFRQFPRVSVVHPMSWPSYLAYTGGIQRDIGLAPLLPNGFNAARGPTKFFDFARMGAVGLYSDVAPYNDFIRPGIDGLLLPNDPERWVTAIAELVEDPGRRQRMAMAGRERALALATA